MWISEICIPLFNILQPHIVFLLFDSDMNSSAIYVYSRLLGSFLDMFFISSSMQRIISRLEVQFPPDTKLLKPKQKLRA